MGLMTVAGLVLLIATANLAGLLLARGAMRRREIAVRLTLGASRWRIARQLLSEGLSLSAVAGGFGILLARALVVIFVDQTPTQFGRYSGGGYALDIPLSVGVFVFTAGTCILTGVLVGLAPARQASKTDLLTALGGTAASASRRTGRLRHWIVVPQVCLSLVLLLVAGAFARPLLRSELTNPGYEADGLLFAEFDFSAYPQMSETERTQFLARRTSFYTRLADRVSSSPGMGTSALAFSLPFEPMRSWVIDRNAYPTGRHWWVAHAAISPRYFDVLRMPLLRGRIFDARDRQGAPKTAIVCERLALWLWPGQNPVGQYIGRHWPESPLEPEWLEIVGVVSEVQPPLSEGAGNPAIYTPLDQAAQPYARSIVVRSPDTPGNVERALRQAIVESDDGAEIYRSGTVNDAITTMRYPRRMAVGILSLSGIMGLILASIGIYGVVSYSVAQRLREIGIRAALGAHQSQLIRLVILDGVKVVTIGSVLGLIGAFVALRLASKLVVALPALDAATFLAVPLVLASVILAACYVPARRAGRVDPITVLRNL
jgi:putative ABC transport system permease protein